MVPFEDFSHEEMEIFVSMQTKKKLIAEAFWNEDT